MGYISSSANNVKLRHVRAMNIDDIPAVRALFKLVFRPHSKSCNENFDRYFQRLFFENAYYDPAIASIVHENDHGEIDSVVAALPIPYTVNGQSIMGRLLCAYMMKPGGSPRGAAELTLSLRPSEKIFSFSDSAAPVSLRHFEAIGGVTLGAHGLGWTRIFKTGSYVTKYVANRLPFLGGLASNAVGKILNPLFPVSQAAKSRATVKEIAQDEAISLIPVLLKSYPAHPAWTEDDFSWLLGMAMENRAMGTLRLFAINDRAGSPTGFFCYYRRPNGMAQVLSVIAKSGTERHAVDGMLFHLQEEGHIAAQGRVDPRYLSALSQQSTMFFRLATNVCVLTARADVLSAVQQNDIFIGGLAGESWSRLSTDFF
ncbi:hypothetical protein ACFWXH_25150 [Mesorhizobium sp. NPDC059054]|uniref:hypothetical protein n=1 Tax=Mesorhizobium sp. NPDC059054 TaxID=3346711 RepID=UPI0036CDF12D